MCTPDEPTTAYEDLLQSAGIMSVQERSSNLQSAGTKPQVRAEIAEQESAYRLLNLNLEVSGIHINAEFELDLLSINCFPQLTPQYTTPISQVYIVWTARLLHAQSG